MLKNHYIKKTKVTKFPSAAHSVIYSSLPADRLLIFDEMVNQALANKEVREIFTTKAGIQNILQELEKLGYVVCIAGVNLEKKLGL